MFAPTVSRANTPSTVRMFAPHRISRQHTLDCEDVCPHRISRQHNLAERMFSRTFPRSTDHPPRNAEITDHSARSKNIQDFHARATTSKCCPDKGSSSY